MGATLNVDFTNIAAPKFESSFMASYTLYPGGIFGTLVVAVLVVYGSWIKIKSASRSRMT